MRKSTEMIEFSFHKQWKSMKGAKKNILKQKLTT